MHPASLLIEIGAVVLGLGVAGTLAKRIGISPIPVYLLAGLAFGQGGLLPLATSEEFVATGAEIGVVLLLLTLGLEYTAEELLGGLHTHAASGLVDLVLNATPGAVAALLLGWGPVAAVVLGGVTYISSSGVIAKTLSDLGRTGNPETPTVLSLLVIEDLAMAVYLPILSAVLVGAGVVQGGLTIGIAVAVVVVVLFAALRYGHAISTAVFTSDDELLLLRVLGLAILVAGVAQQLKVSAAVGAFLVGLALSGEVAGNARVVLRPLRDLFAAVFFVFFGLQTDPGSIPAVAVPALLLGLVTAATKVAVGWYAARRTGLPSLAGLRAGGALVARGEFSVVIAGLAVATGLEPRLATLAGTYVLLMAVTGPLAARAAEPLGRLLLPSTRSPAAP